MVPGDLPLPARIIPGQEMRDPVTGAKAHLAVESVDPNLEMSDLETTDPERSDPERTDPERTDPERTDQEKDQPANQMTAGPKSSVKPSSYQTLFWGENFFLR